MVEYQKRRCSVGEKAGWGSFLRAISVEYPQTDDGCVVAWFLDVKGKVQLQYPFSVARYGH